MGALEVLRNRALQINIYQAETTKRYAAPMADTKCSSACNWSFNCANSGYVVLRGYCVQTLSPSL